MVGLCFAFAASIYQSTRHGAPVSFWQMGGPLIALLVIYALGSFSLQCMRIRDIGWDPVCVIPTWIAILVLDHLVASKFPAFALDAHHNSTIVSGLLNFGMVLVLMFWPSAEYVATPPSFDAPSRQADPPPRRGSESAVSSRVARVANGEFGRRSG